MLQNIHSLLSVVFTQSFYTLLQFLNTFQDHRSKSSQHIQSGHCRSDNQALTVRTYYGQRVYLQNCIVWK